MASNFANAIKATVDVFEKQTGHRVILIFGSTGKHYAQIRNGAPFEAFFAADAARPALLESEGVAQAGSRFTYAVGKVVLWSPDPDLIGAGADVLIEGRFWPGGEVDAHSFVESPDMMNIYNGNITTGANGHAGVHLPEWFEALNRDFRYQLTVIGSFARAMVAKKVRDNRFVIRTSEPGVEVSWQVTGIRDDAYARAHPIEVEQLKPADARGSYQFTEYEDWMD